MPIITKKFKLINFSLKAGKEKREVPGKYYLGHPCMLLCFCVFVILCISFCSYTLSGAAEITGPFIKIQDNDIYVTTGLSLDERYFHEISNGATKEFRIYIDLFRVWELWPDEFITSKYFIKTLKCDPVKMEYTATSNDGTTLTQKRFKSLESMLKLTLSINDLKLASMRELEPGIYFIRITVESRIRKLPPVIGYFMIFLPENEFRIKKDSSSINVGNAGKPK
jgi:hypothetical protein